MVFSFTKQSALTMLRLLRKGDLAKAQELANDIVDVTNKYLVIADVFNSIQQDTAPFPKNFVSQLRWLSANTKLLVFLFSPVGVQQFAEARTFALSISSKWSLQV